jgi:hypothetical protein
VGSGVAWIREGIRQESMPWRVDAVLSRPSHSICRPSGPASLGLAADVKPGQDVQPSAPTPFIDQGKLRGLEAARTWRPVSRAGGM